MHYWSSDTLVDTPPLQTSSPSQQNDLNLDRINAHPPPSLHGGSSVTQELELVARRPRVGNHDHLGYRVHIGS
ncbi:hypothetical protein TNCV_3555951 [Trichonephila clavipes]|nr:hypothetical protein TNCV_3555951 [Trichonephila clavipes]